MNGQGANGQRRARGAQAYHAGRVAEAAVAQHYSRTGREIAAARWRGPGGEIDLIARDGAQVIFIEVKRSSTHARAAEHLRPAQIARLYASAQDFLEGEPRGQLTEVRFDVALVDGQGRIEVLENAFAA